MLYVNIQMKMADKSKISSKPVPMKLFATWEVDRTPPNCIPRLCSLTLTRLVLLKSLGQEVSSIIIAVKMQGLKRTLRSNEIPLPQTGLLDTELQLNFSLQYPHFLKRDGNNLQIMLQRRKRYKNRTILGYKILAEGFINMSQVLQRQTDMELDLIGECKQTKLYSIAIGRISVSGLSSQPVDHHEDNSKASDDEDDFSSANEEGVGEGECSDSEPIMDDTRRTRKNKINGNVRQRNLKQRFISLLKRFRVNEELQSLDNDQEMINSKLSVNGDMDGVDIEDLFDQLENLSDSGPEVDTMSISSTPKPSLRPFFSSSRSLLHEGLSASGRPLLKKHKAIATKMHAKHSDRILERVSDESSKKADSDSHADNWSDSDTQQANASPPDDKKEKYRKSRLFNRDRNNLSGGKCKKPQEQKFNNNVKEIHSPSQKFELSTPIIENRKPIIEQLSWLTNLGEDGWMPDELFLINAIDPHGSMLINNLQSKQFNVISLATSTDIKTVISFLLNKMQKFCNTLTKRPVLMKLLMAGSDCFINNVLRHYVTQLSTKPPDWITCIKFYFIPLGPSYLSRYLASIDTVYSNTFVSDSWRECLENMDEEEILNRIQGYLHQANGSIHLPLAEAMLTCKRTSSNEESSQVFIPFVFEVRLGNDCAYGTSMDSLLPDDAIITSPPAVASAASTPLSPPALLVDKKIPESSKPSSPPNSPNINNFHLTSQARETSSCELLDLQLDYWLMSSKINDGKTSDVNTKKNDSGKLTLKNSFRSLQIVRFWQGEQPYPSLTINYSIKEKKQKIMRLGKKKEKEKDVEMKSVSVDGVFRLICSPRSHNVPLIVSIDGNEWTGVKFFQLSAQWQTHIRSFPITLFTSPSDINSNS